MGIYEPDLKEAEKLPKTPRPARRGNKTALSIMPLESPRRGTLHCAGCGAASAMHPVVNLGTTPLANSYIAPGDVARAEACYPLRAYVCADCWLVQVPPVVTPEHIFGDYAYFSSFSETWQAHCAAYAAMLIDRLHLTAASQIIEIASNDGILLQQFQRAGMSVLGIEPARNIATHANARHIPTRTLFFGSNTARRLVKEGLHADVIIANNVLAHVPDLHDFIAGFSILLKPEGTITFEFPHLLEMLRHTQFDTIYHEHFSYLSLTALAPLLARHGLVMADVEQLPIHGGSLRLFVRHQGAAVLPAVAALQREEEAFGLTQLAAYSAFEANMRRARDELLATLNRLHAAGKRVAAYGAPAKGNTLLNYCGITPQQVAYTVDLNPKKQGCLLPGSRLPVYAPAHLLADKPDVVFILPWNIADEVMEQMRGIREWGGQFLIASPQVRLL